MDVQDLTEKLCACGSLDRAAAAQQLCESAEEARPAAVALVRAVGDEDEAVQEWATAALEELGPPEVKDLPHLVELVADKNDDVAYWAVTLLGRLEAEGTEGVDVLTDALHESRQMIVRQRAAWALGRIGSSEAAVQEALTSAANDSDARLARLASEALQAIGD